MTTADVLTFTKDAFELTAVTLSVGFRTLNCCIPFVSIIKLHLSGFLVLCKTAPVFVCVEDSGQEGHAG